MRQVSTFIEWGSAEVLQDEINEWIEIMSKTKDYPDFKIIDMKFNTNIVKDCCNEEKEITEYNVLVIWEYSQN